MADISIKKKLDGKIAIITGGASGIGEATAHLFAKYGARAVVIADIQDDKGHAVVESIGSERCSYVHCDVTDEEQVKTLVDFTVKTYGGLDIMFSNAAIASVSDQTILELDMSGFDRVMHVNTRSMALCVKHAAKKMVGMGTRGAIVCTASVASVTGGALDTDYFMSKHAVLGVTFHNKKKLNKIACLVRSASVQLGVHGIRVNSMSPSAVVTPMMRQYSSMQNADDVERAVGPMIRLKGVALTIDHLAEAAAFLASDESAFVTGLNLIVDGGLTV